jgi:hypothetical protein
MASKKQKRKHDEEKQKRQPSKQEKDMFTMSTCAHDAQGNPVNWTLIKSLWGY